MAKSYKTIQGDTFEIISRKVFGDESGSFKIERANPGLIEPFIAGVLVSIPEEPEAFRSGSVTTNGENDVSILIDGKQIFGFSSATILRSIDSFDTISFLSPYDPNDGVQRDIYRPFSYKKIEVFIGVNAIFTGVMVNSVPVVSNDGLVVSCSGYSKPGVINDCMPLLNKKTLEYNGVGLIDISRDLVSPFGLAVVFNDDQGSIFERVAIDPTQSILNFLTGLAKQRGLIISNNNSGDLVFSKSVSSDDDVSSILKEGVLPVLSIQPFFSPQNYYSDITGIEPVFVGRTGSQYTVKNERLPGIIRPMNFTVEDTLDADIKGSCQSKIGRMFGNMASYDVDLSSWRDSNGKIWEANKIVELTAPGAMVYNGYKFIVRSVEFNMNRDSFTSRLNLVMPGAFSSEIPKALPWEE